MLCVISPRHVIVGFWRSFIVTVKEQLAVLPNPSVTKKVFVVVPTGNVAPDANPAICVVIDPRQLSVPIGALYVTTASHISKSLPCVMSPIQVIAGF